MIGSLYCPSLVWAVAWFLLSVSPNIWSSLHFYMFSFPDEAMNQQTDVNLPALVAGKQKNDYQPQKNLVFIAPKCKHKRNPWSRIIPAQRPLPLDTIDVFPVKHLHLLLACSRHVGEKTLCITGVGGRVDEMENGSGKSLKWFPFCDVLESTCCSVYRSVATGDGTRDLVSKCFSRR